MYLIESFASATKRVLLPGACLILLLVPGSVDASPRVVLGELFDSEY